LECVDCWNETAWVLIYRTPRLLFCFNLPKCPWNFSLFMSFCLNYSSYFLKYKFIYLHFWHCFDKLFTSWSHDKIVHEARVSLTLHNVVLILSSARIWCRKKCIFFSYTREWHHLYLDAKTLLNDAFNLDLRNYYLHINQIIETKLTSLLLKLDKVNFSSHNTLCNWSLKEDI
jgi:hypothetical protein